MLALIMRTPKMVPHFKKTPYMLSLILGTPPATLHPGPAQGFCGIKKNVVPLK